MVHTYGREVLEQNNYNKYLDRALVSEKRKNSKAAMGLSFLFFGIFGFYAYAFYFAGFSKWNEFTDNNGKIVTAGTIITVIFCIIMSSMALGGIVPHMTSLTEARVAGTIAFGIIDHQSSI